MNYHMLLAIFYVAAASAFPMRLLKVPKIYNALITTNQKLLPSEALPASTGPVFQPIGLSGDPVLLNPEAFARDDTPLVEGEEPRPFAKNGKMPTPLVFYPRYNVYHQLPQSVFPYQSVYQPPPIVVPVQRSSAPHQPPPQEEEEVAEDEAVEEVTAPAPPSPERPPQPQIATANGYITNNSPQNSDIPNVPPPPPPVGAARPQERSSQSEEESS